MAIFTATSSDGTTLQADSERMTVTFGVRQVATERRVVEFIVLLLRVAPAVLTYEVVNRELLLPDHIAQTDTLPYVRKLKLKADRVVQAAGAPSGFIVNVRSVGYRVDPTWRVAPPAILLLNGLAGVLEQSVALMLSTPLVESDQGQRSLDRDLASPALVDLVDDYDRVVGDLWRSLDLSEGPSGRNSLCRQILADIRTYVTFSRTGEVPDEVWRELFVRELKERAAMLVRAISL